VQRLNSFKQHARALCIAFDKPCVDDQESVTTKVLYKLLGGCDIAKSEERVDDLFCLLQRRAATPYFIGCQQEPKGDRGVGQLNKRPECKTNIVLNVARGPSRKELLTKQRRRCEAERFAMPLRS